jgi:hypothetical protein
MLSHKHNTTLMKKMLIPMLAVLSLLLGCKSKSSPFGDTSELEFTGKIAMVDRTTKSIDLETLSETPSGSVESHGTVHFRFASDTKFFEGDRQITADDLVVGKEVRYRFEDGKGYRPLLVSLRLPAHDAQ